MSNMLNSASVQTVLAVLTQAEAFLAGTPIVIPIPEEDTVIDGIKVKIAATSLTISK